MGISSSKNNRESDPIREMNLEIGLDTNCPIRDTFFYSHIESISRCENNIIGFGADSASPSDIYKIELNDAGGNTVQNVIMKLFLVNDPFGFLRDNTGNMPVTIRTTFRPVNNALPNLQIEEVNNIPLARVNYEAQVYELVIYLEKIKKLLDYNLCPYFIKSLGGNVNIPANSIWRYLFTLPNGAPRPGIEFENFLRNLIIMRFSSIYKINGERFEGNYLSIPERPAINNNVDNINIHLHINSAERLNTGNTLNTEHPGLGADDGSNYFTDREIIYNINATTMIDNLKTGYILTEEETSPKFNEILNLIKVIDIPFNNDIVTYGNFTCYRLLRNIEDIINNNTITDVLFNNFMAPLRTLIDNLRMNPDTSSFVEFSKIGNKIRDINNFANNTFFRNPTPENRNILLDKTVKLRRFSVSRRTPTNIGYRIIIECVFHILIACYSLYLSGIAHNDLHVGNVFIEIGDNPIEYNYIINENLYVINTICKAKIYDFDRSYVINHNNQLLNNNRSSQNNVLINPKDFIKVLCYIANLNISNEINNYLVQVVNNPDLNERFRILGTFYEENCFLQLRDPAGNLRSADNQLDFVNCHRYSTLVEIFGNSIGYSRNINEVIYNPAITNYVLDRRFFDPQGNFLNETYLRFLTYISTRFARTV